MDKIVSLCQAARLRLPVVGDLRRARLVVRLRPLRRPAEGQHQAALALGDGAGARRHRRARLVDHPPPAGLGGVGPRRRLHRPARRLQVSASSASAPITSTESQCGQRPSKRPGETSDCDLTEARQFNLMFETTRRRRSRRRASPVYLRPETAQGIFINFKNVAQIARRKPPFGIAQVGKSFRNEITPGNFIFRTLEFEQMEMEFFVPPAEAERVVPLLGARARCDWHRRYGAPREPPAHPRRTTPTSSPTTRAGRATSSTCSRSAGRSSRAIANRGDFDLDRAHGASGDEARVGRARTASATRRT